MKHRPYLPLIIGILAIGGFCFGLIAWLFLPDMLAAELRSYVAEQLQNIGNTLLLSESIKTVLCANIMDVLRIYLLGLCLAGLPILIVWFFLKCFSIGFSFCLLLQHSFLLCLTRILFLPVLCAAALIGCRFALQLMQNQIESPIRQWLHYSVIFLGLLLSTIIVSGLDGCCTYYFVQ